MLKLFITINNQLEKPLEVEQLKRSFEKNYPDFSKEVNTIISIQDGFPSNKNQRRYGPILERGGFDRISQLADAALYFSRQRFGYKEKLKQHMLRGENIPEFYYYFTEEGAEYWIQMTSDRQYRFQSNSIRLIKSFSNTIAAIIAKYSKDIDFISLGSGDGKKDHHIITELMNNKMNSVMYYPVDISDKLLVECIKNVFLDNLDHRGVRTKAILADITNLHVLKSVYEDRPSPNVFSILGNTFGNSDEAEILENLQQSMYPGDFLLIEVNCDTEDETFFKSNIKLEYSCLPLFILGLSINIDNVDIREMPKNKKRSIFKCAKSFETIYHNVVIDEIPIKEVILGYDHRYNFKLFQSELAEYLDAEVLKAEVKGNVGILLMQKKS